MSMIYCLKPLSRAEFDNLLVNPSDIFAMIDDEYDEDKSEEENAADDERPFVFLDKAWEAIVYLLSDKKGLGETGEKAFSTLLFSGQVFDEAQDLGYGPAQYHTPEQVAAWHERVKSIDRATFLQNYDAAAMNEAGVYPGGWTDEDRDFLYEAFETLQNAFADAAKNGDAMTAYLA